MNAIFAMIKRHPMIMFVTLAYLLSWWSAPFTNGQIMPQGPAVAAVIVLAITAGRPGLRSLWGKVTCWRVAWYWYVIGPGMVASYLLGGYALMLLTGSTGMNLPHLPSLGTILELLLLGGLWEEPGWSGYALPKSQERFAGRPNGPLLATLLTGGIRAAWHLPLFIYGHLPWFDILVFSFAFQIMISWLFNRSGSSVLVTMVFHFASNVLAGGIMFPAFTDAARTSYYALCVVLACGIALVILWKSSLRLGLNVMQQKRAIAGQPAV